MDSFLREIEYNHWANHRMLDAVAQLSVDQFNRNLGSSFPSIHDTLIHMMWAEWMWLERWQGHSPREYWSSTKFVTLEDVLQRWSTIEAGQKQFVNTLEDGAEHRLIRYANFKSEEWVYTLGQMVKHCLLHSAYHRGQLATLLRQCGTTPPPTDYLVYIDVQGW
jgi:uncharacterized damage-inducible protein DinB